MASVGIGGAVWSACKKDPYPASLWGPLLYFSLMEALQSYTYTVINQCSLPANQIATLLAYLHIVFQPFFINALAMYFLPRELASRLYMPVFFLCFVASIIMLLQLYPFDWAGMCELGRPLCGRNYTRSPVIGTSLGRCRRTALATGPSTIISRAISAILSPSPSCRFCTGRGASPSINS
jgi:hypothetical protein